MTRPAGAGIGGSREATTLVSSPRITDAALAYLPEQELLEEPLDRISELLEVDMRLHQQELRVVLGGRRSRGWCP